MMLDSILFLPRRLLPRSLALNLKQRRLPPPTATTMAMIRKMPAGTLPFGNLNFHKIHRIPQPQTGSPRTNKKDKIRSTVTLKTASTYQDLSADIESQYLVLAYNNYNRRNERRGHRFLSSNCKLSLLPSRTNGRDWLSFLSVVSFPKPNEKKLTKKAIPAFCAFRSFPFTPATFTSSWNARPHPINYIKTPLLLYFCVSA